MSGGIRDILQHVQAQSTLAWVAPQRWLAVIGLLAFSISCVLTAFSIISPAPLSVGWWAGAIELAGLSGALLNAVLWYPSIRVFDRAPLKSVLIYGEIAFVLACLVLTPLGEAIATMRGPSESEIAFQLLGPVCGISCIACNSILTLVTRQRVDAEVAQGFADHEGQRQNISMLASSVRTVVLSVAGFSFTPVVVPLIVPFIVTTQGVLWAALLRVCLLLLAALSVVAAGIEVFQNPLQTPQVRNAGSE